MEGPVEMMVRGASARSASGPASATTTAASERAYAKTVAEDRYASITT